MDLSPQNTKTAKTNIEHLKTFNENYSLLVAFFGVCEPVAFIYICDTFYINMNVLYMTFLQHVTSKQILGCRCF